jgi:hypothetical protein
MNYSSKNATNKNTSNNYGFYFDIENQSRLNGDDILFLNRSTNETRTKIKPKTVTHNMTVKQINELLSETQKPNQKRQRVFTSVIGITCVLFTIFNVCN